MELVWLLICCVLIELLCGYWTNKKENYNIPNVNLPKNYFYDHEMTLTVVLTLRSIGQNKIIKTYLSNLEQGNSNSY